MPSYLDFDTTKVFRDKLLIRTLDPIYGNSPSPKTFKSDDYSIQNLSDTSNLLLPQVDGNRTNDLLIPKTSNIFKPTEYFVKDTIDDLPRRANLNLYPYFVKTDESLISIMATKSYDTESELFKFAAHNIRTNTNGPILSRINQNLYNTTTAKNKIGEALMGNTTTLINIIRGKQPLIEGNNKITVSSSLLGKGIDLLGTIAGTQLPFSTIPGDYLSNPRAPINVRPTDVSTGTKVWQDLTGVLGSIVGIQRRPLPSRKPSDLLIENMGNSSKYRLFDLLSFSKYAPNYTTSARSQMSTNLGKIPGLVAQGIKSILGVEAPTGLAYIGDDRANDVKNATTDLFSGRTVRSSYYLSVMFDETATKLFHTSRNITENGKVAGNLTWISKNSKTKLYKPDNVNGTQSTGYNFREDSILETTQQILDSKPQNGKETFSHIGHILDQTSRYFQDGDTIISRGSGVKYMDNSGKDIGIEYARVWTKDRPYLTYRDTMPFHRESVDRPYYKRGFSYKRDTNIRKYDGSVMSSRWNLNMAPMSDGTRGFDGSTNILKNEKGEGFYAKKYMLSIENLAWKSSTLPGFTVNDLPYSERGPNGGRVMWFPPYDLKFSEQNNAKWEENIFLGRPEPIFTYQNTTRGGTLSFKVVVDHPSILNLLVREHFKSVSDDKVDEYINSFFAGAKDIDFYSLIRLYSNLDSDDVKMIQDYLNSGIGDEQSVNRLKTNITPPTTDNPDGTKTNDSNSETVSLDVKLNYQNDFPLVDRGGGTADYYSINSYIDLVDNVINNKQGSIVELEKGLNEILTGTTTGDTSDRVLIFGKDVLTEPEKSPSIEKVKTSLNTLFLSLENDKNKLKTNLETLKSDLQSGLVKNKVIKIIVGSSSSSLNDGITDQYNYKLSVRRSHSIVRYILDKLSDSYDSKWYFDQIASAPGMEKNVITVAYSFASLGYDKVEGDLVIQTINYGEKVIQDGGTDCSKINFQNKNLRQFSPLSYGCRQSSVKFSYQKSQKIDEATNLNKDKNKATPNGNVSTSKTKPPVDVMKRIIMKTLSEQYYFKKLEADSPLVFSSLKEKLKYFHPGFHSMTPEGLNSRLTFLQQCLRPGDTIPVKGISDNSDIGARNTTFGPPPICVLRVGDFYNSKVVIKDLNIQFEDSPWDLNPEGIGVQPLIASVTLQLSFIGGHGLEKPVERLQNALSSNFYANTEMYDERSISTTTSIGGKTGNTFTMEFIKSLNDKIIQQTTLKDSNGKGYNEGTYVGLLSSISTNGGPKTYSLKYTTLVDDLYKKTETYYTGYQNMYNSMLTTYGGLLTNLIVNKKYRTVNTFTGDMGDVELFGLYDSPDNLGAFTNSTSKKLIEWLENKFKTDRYYILDMFDLYDEVIKNKIEYTCPKIHEYIIKNIPTKLSSISESKALNNFESTRDQIISILDKLNFITKNGYDVKLEKSLTTQALYTSGTFNKNDFYDSYSPCIEYINNNKEKMYSKLDQTIDFTKINLQESEVQNILQTLFYSSKSEILDTIKSGLTEDEFNMFSKKLTKKLFKEKEVNLKFTKAPIRKNSKEISYSITSQLPIDTTDEIKNLFSTQYKIKDKKLNFYKK